MDPALRKIASGHLGREIAAALLAVYAAAEIERHPVDAGEMLELALRTGLTACDAGYLWLARTLGAPLATFDAELGTAALRELRGA